MDRGEQSLIARRGEALLELLAFRVADDRMRVDVVDSERLLAEGRRGCRERLRRPGLFTRHVALRHGAFLDRPDRRARNAVEDVEETRLAGDRDHVDALAVPLDGRQLRRRVAVEVPEVVVGHLEVPQPLARSRVERDDRAAEQVGAGPVRAVVVVGGRPDGKVRDAPLGVDRDLAPRVDAADVLVRVFRPRLVAELSRMRNRVELPHELSRDHVEGAEIARAATGSPRPVADPSRIRFSKIRPGVPDWMRPMVAGSRPSPSRRSTTPSLPNS